jgi:hypothetical protein
MKRIFFGAIALAFCLTAMGASTQMRGPVTTSEKAREVLTNETALAMQSALGLSATDITNAANGAVVAATNNLNSSLVTRIANATNDVATRTTAATNDLNTVLRSVIQVAVTNGDTRNLVLVGSNTVSGQFSGNLLGSTNMDGSAINPWTNSIVQSAYDYSVNLSHVPNLQKALRSTGHRLKLMWFGDSTGGDSVAAFYSAIASNYVYGVEPIILLNGPSAYFDLPTGCVQILDPNNWWANSFSLTNGVTQTFGVRNSQLVAADRIGFWFSGGANRGTCILQTSPDNSSWTTRATVNEALYTGVNVTNITIPIGNYYVRVTTTVAGSENRTVYLWPELYTSTSQAVQFFDGHAAGNTFPGFLTMGTNNIVSVITNFAPDVIFWQQTKQVSTMNQANFEAIRFLIKTYATNCDFVLVQSHTSSDPSINADPANGGIYQMAAQRAAALTNGWPLVDNYSPLSDWHGFIVSNSFNGDAAIHLNGAGQLFSGLTLLKQLRVLDEIALAGLLKAYPSVAEVVTNTFNLTNSGPFYTTPTNFSGTLSSKIDGTAANTAGLFLAGPRFVVRSDLFNATEVSGTNGIYFEVNPAGGYANVLGIAMQLFKSGGLNLNAGEFDGTRTDDPGAGCMNIGGTLKVGGGTAISKVMSATGTLNFSSTSAQSSADLTITVTGAATGDVVALAIPTASVNANTSYTAWVSAADTVTVRFNNYSSGAVDPASGVFRAMVTHF